MPTELSGYAHFMWKWAQGERGWKRNREEGKEEYAHFNSSLNHVTNNGLLFVVLHRSHRLQGSLLITIPRNIVIVMKREKGVPPQEKSKLSRVKAKKRKLRAVLARIHNELSSFWVREQARHLDSLRREKEEVSALMAMVYDILRPGKPSRTHETEPPVLIDLAAEPAKELIWYWL